MQPSITYDGCMTLAIDPRTVRALKLASHAATWTRLASGAFRIPSLTTPGQSYVCSPEFCQCEASRQRPNEPCKHQIACAVVSTLIESQPEPARSGLVATREDDDVVAWDRPKRTPSPLSDAEAERILGRL